ncbi:MAG: YqgE/AlgH family protein [Pirellulaceae bacterium]
MLLLQHSSRGSLGVAINERFQESLRQIRGRMADPLLQRGGGFSRRVAFRVELVRWGPGQLDAEVNQGVWLTSPAKLHEVFGSHNDLWIDLVRHIGRSVLSDALKIQNMPPDPTVN